MRNTLGASINVCGSEEVVWLYQFQSVQQVLPVWLLVLVSISIQSDTNDLILKMSLKGHAVLFDRCLVSL